MTVFAPLRMRTHPKVLIGPAFIVVLGLGVIAAAAVLVPTLTSIGWAVPAVAGAVLLFLLFSSGVPYLRWHHGRFAVDMEKITVRVGILNRKTTEIPIHRLTQVSCEQSIMDRLWKCGTLVLVDASAVQGGVRFDDIPNVLVIQAELNTLIYERAATAG